MTMPTTVDSLGVVEASGPSKGNFNPYRTVSIPKDNAEQPMILRVRYVPQIKKPTPIARPSNPVVKGNMISSLGCENSRIRMVST